MDNLCSLSCVSFEDTNALTLTPNSVLLHLPECVNASANAGVTEDKLVIARAIVQASCSLLISASRLEMSPLVNFFLGLTNAM